MEIKLTSKHSIFGKISFITLIVGLIFFVFRVADLAISNYSFYEKIPLLNSIGTYIDVMLILSGSTSFITGLISLFKKNTEKLLPTISLSITSFMLFIFVLLLIQQSALVYNVDKGIVTNYGIFEIPSKTSIDNSTTYLYEQRYLKKNTEDIPALKGIRFGFNYVIIGEPDGETIQIMKITKYPESGLRKNNRIILSDTTYFAVTLNKLRYSGYLLGHDYELIAGKWEFEFWYKGKILFTKKFNLFYQL